MTKVIKNDTGEEIRLGQGESVNVVAREEDSKSTVSRIKTWIVEEVRDGR